MAGDGQGRRRGRAMIGTVAAALLLGGCLDSGPTTADGAARQYRPAFGGSGGAASVALAGVRAPSVVTCRFVRASGRVECDPVTESGVTFTASYQFLDAAGTPQPERTDRTNTINERIEMVGVPVDVGVVEAVTIRFDSLRSRSDVTRRGVAEAITTISGSHEVRSGLRLINGRDTTRSATVARTEWRDLRYPRDAATFRPVAAITPGANVDSATAVVRLTGAWAISGSRLDETLTNLAAAGMPGAMLTSATITYLNADAATVESRTGAPNATRRTLCRVDRLSFSATCQ